uniref:HhH-GPD domain-containing protein n=1 Tax=Physcomitrium patens TaxID=3218 RepID=A0A7I4BEJ6_PHYPA
MEDNAFAAFSFSAPAPPTSWNRTEKTVKVCALAPGSNLRLRLIQRRKLTAKVERFDAAATVGRLPCLVKTEPKLEIEDSDQAISGNIVKVESSSKAVKARQSRSKADNSTKECAPENWEQIVQGIRSMRMGKDAPVDLFGTHQLFDIEADKGTQQFQALVAAMISSQTRDAVTGAAMQRLRAMPGGLNVAHIASDDVEIDALAEILKPVGFYRQKAKFMKSIAQSLAAPPHNGAVPNSLEELG